jgi:hypothetical protein
LSSGSLSLLLLLLELLLSEPLLLLLLLSSEELEPLLLLLLLLLESESESESEEEDEVSLSLPAAAAAAACCAASSFGRLARMARMLSVRPAAAAGAGKDVYEGAGWTGLIEKEQAPCRQRCGLLGCDYMHRSVSGSS